MFGTLLMLVGYLFLSVSDITYMIITFTVDIAHGIALITGLVGIIIVTVALAISILVSNKKEEKQNDRNP